MAREKEFAVEEKFIKDLQGIGYTYIPTIKDETTLKENFKEQFCKFNKIELTDKEFERFYRENITKVGMEAYPVFAAAKMLRGKVNFVRDNGELIYLSFLSEDSSENIYQVANQISVSSGHRYDVTILINGLPLVQTELKRTCVEVSKAKAQINRYCKNSYNGLFYFIQLFICSNGNTTYYGANNDNKVIEYSAWTDRYNDPCVFVALKDFTPRFLNKSSLIEFICDYEIVKDIKNEIIAMRPYQVYATEGILKMIDEKTNAYVWHTTGSGKTLTSWKISSLVVKRKKDIEKVILVVDSNSLDKQSREKYAEFDPYSTDINEKNKNDKTITKHLIDQLNDSITRQIIVTVQTLNSAIRNKSDKLTTAKDKRIVFIVDEAHRSWYSKQKNAIKNFFTNANYYGLTGTPLFRGKNVGMDEADTEEVFGKCIHYYTIKDAIRDKNVLGFDIDWYNSCISEEDVKKLMSEETSEIDKETIYHNPNRISKISENIVSSINRKALNNKHSAMLVTDSIKGALLYYDEIRKQAPNLKVATIFSALDNEGERFGSSQKEELERVIKDYNDIFETKFTIDEADKYEVDVASRMRHQHPKVIDLLIVVNMFTTGFDSKYISCMYIDKNLKYHTLIQTISRANRIEENKIRANIVVFRDLKKEFEEAIKLFSNGEGIDELIARTYGDYLNAFITSADKLKTMFPNPVEILKAGEDDIAEYIGLYRETAITINRLMSFECFDWDKTEITDHLTEKEFDDYTGYFRDLKSVVSKSDFDGISAEDLEFDVYMEDHTVINLSYILNLLRNVKTKKELKDIERTIKNSDDPDIEGIKEPLIKAIKKADLNSDENVDEQVIKLYNQERNNEIKKLAELCGLTEESIITNIIGKMQYGEKVKGNDICKLFIEALKESICELSELPKKEKLKIVSKISNNEESIREACKKLVYCF